MWATGTTQMIARLTSSTLFANHNLAYLFAFEQRPVSTTTTGSSTSDQAHTNVNVITKMRELRARSPYVLFVKDNYSEISAKNPDLKLVDISKKIGEAWKNLSDEQKQSYNKRFQDQKANYAQEKQRLSANDLQSVDADEKARKIEQRVKKSIQQLPTKRARSAYVIYLSSLDRGEADLGQFMKGAAQRWSQMSVQDKQKFEDLHEEEKAQYAKALARWASANEQPKAPTRRSVSTQTRDTTVKKTRSKSATGKRAVKKRTATSAKPAVSTATSTRKKSPKATSDKETSSSDDETSKPKTRKSVKFSDAKQ